MAGENLKSYTAFKDKQCVASGSLVAVAGKVKTIIDEDDQACMLVFNDDTGELVELDLRGTIENVLTRLETSPEGRGGNVASEAEQRPKKGPGRPKLGVVSREVTLLPRHWEWLNSQPGGASVALRKLVEEARRVNRTKDRVRHSQEVAYRFMHAIAGDFPGFEEATRALFACDSERFNDLVALWPMDIREYARKLASVTFEKQL